MTVWLVTIREYIGPKTKTGRRYFAVYGLLEDFNDTSVGWDWGRGLNVDSHEQIVVTDVQLEYDGAAGVKILAGFTDESAGRFVFDLDVFITTLVSGDWIPVHGLRAPVTSNARLELIISPAPAATDDIGFQISGWIE